MKTLYLIDGYAQFYRAYHAIRTPMTSPVTGEPTNMTFGFVGMLLKLLRGEGHAGDEGRPELVAVALDVSGDRGTFRSQIYPEYKATRPPTPEDLRPQIRRCLTILEQIGVPMVGAEGFEADDAIATLADRLAGDVRIRVISKDKDLKQLLAPDRLELYDIHTDALITADTLREESGIEPAQVIDMLALMGDNVDNIPGVDGVGPKTSAQLIAQYGSLAKLIEHADEIKGKRGERLREAVDWLATSRELVTLRHDAPVEFDLARARTASFDLGALKPVLAELGFNRYRDELRELMGEAPSEQGSIFESTPQAPARPRARRDADQPSLFDPPAEIDAPVIEPESGEYRCVRTRDDLAALVRELEGADAISLDTETTSPRPMRAQLCGLSFATHEGTGWYVPVRSPEPDTHFDERTVLDALRPILEDASRPKIGHNLKYDLIVLRRHGVALRGLIAPGACDTMVASYVLDPSRSGHSLDALALAVLGRHNIALSELIGSGARERSFDTVGLDLATPYAAEDADVALQLAQRMLPAITDAGLCGLFQELEMPLVPVLAELEFNGVRVDPAELAVQRKALEGEIATLRARIDDEAMASVGRTFDPDSPKQLAGVLFHRQDAPEPGLGLRPLRRGKTGPSTDHEVLEKLAQNADIETQLPQLILDYRQLTKLVNTYLVSLADEINPETGRIHSSFNQTVAATGRLASSDPNLQNIPIRSEVGRTIRKAFVADEGNVLITADYSQIELRLLAHLSRDPALIEAFREGEDIHRAVAAQIHGVAPDEVTREQRNGAKMVNFGIVYGITPFGLARRLGVSNTEAGEIIDSYKRRFAGITVFLQECIAQAQEQGYVETMMKRRRPIHEIEARNPARRALAERMAINSVVQGSAADLIKLAMVDLHALIGAAQDKPKADTLTPPRGPAVSAREVDALRATRMILQVHDELVFEAPEADAERAKLLIVSRMESAMTLDVPLVADAAVSRDWYAGK